MEMDVLSPFSFYGGKAKMAPLICRMLDYENTDIYIEPFGGACRVLLNKPRHEFEMYNDFGIGLYEFFSCMSRPELSEKVISALYDIIPSKEVFQEMRDYKIEHESELTDYMKMQFKTFVYECNRKYRSKDLSRLHSQIMKKEYKDIIEISRKVLKGNMLQKKEERLLRHYVELYEEYWEMAKKDYKSAYAKAGRAFDKAWKQTELKGNRDRHRHTASHNAALLAIEDKTGDILVSNGGEATMDSVDMAVATFASYYLSRDGMGKAYSETKGSSIDAYYRQLAKLDDVADRFQGVRVTQFDALWLVAKYSQLENAMLYLDPSYLSTEDEEKKKKDLGKGIYNRSFDYDMHESLALLIQDAEAHIIVSNYDVEPYKSLLTEEHGWKRMEFPTTTSVGGKKGNFRTEVLWYNY